MPSKDALTELERRLGALRITMRELSKTHEPSEYYEKGLQHLAQVALNGAEMLERDRRQLKITV